MNDEFILKCIDGKNEHGENGQTFHVNIGNIPRDEKKIWVARSFFLQLHFKLLKLPQLIWARRDDFLKTQEEIKKNIKSEVFRLMLKHC